MKSAFADPAVPAAEPPAADRARVPANRIVRGAPAMAERLAARAKGIRQSPIRGITRTIEERGGVNLGQGTCPLPPHPDVIAAAHRAMQANQNSYTTFDGIPPLKEALRTRLRSYNKLEVAPEHLVVTSGASGAFESVCKAFLEPGDEVIVFEPIYGYHHAQIRERGAVPVSVRLHAPTWSFRADELEAAFTERTKLFVFSNPNNPSGKVFTRDELTAIGEACRRHGVIAVVDEVYEYILGPGAEHVSLASLPGMWEHTVTMGSASKTLFITGWRIGWLCAPAEVAYPMGVKFDETYICAPSPFQHAVAEAFTWPDAFFENVKVPFQRRRERLLEALRGAGFRPHDPEGAYYILADYTGALEARDDLKATFELLDRVNVGAVPANAFFPSEAQTGMLRFCFAQDDAEIDRACELLAKL